MGRIFIRGFGEEVEKEENEGEDGQLEDGLRILIGFLGFLFLAHVFVWINDWVEAHNGDRDDQNEEDHAE